MITLKMHIGFFVLLAMVLTLIWSLSDVKRKKYEWHVPTETAFLITLIFEAFGWAFWWFFIL